MVNNQEKPIFLLGTGRCGSTYWQRMLCSADDVWIWGEHEGILLSFAIMLSALGAKSQLSKWSLDLNKIILTPDIEAGDATRFAWNNGFDRNILLGHVVNFVTNLFKENLPAGKSRWGFKEIRYGHGSNVAEFLLELFPYGKVIITSRDARETIISSLVSWHRAEIELFVGGYDNNLQKQVAGYVDKWIRFGNFSLGLQNKYPNQVGFSYLGQPDSVQKVFDFLDVAYTENIHAIENSMVNENRSARQYADNEKFTALIDGLLYEKADEIAAITNKIKQWSSPNHLEQQDSEEVGNVHLDSKDFEESKTQVLIES